MVGLPDGKKLLNCCIRHIRTAYILHTYRVTTCMTNVEMTRILAAVSKTSGILLKVRKCQAKNLVWEKLPETVCGI